MVDSTTAGISRSGRVRKKSAKLKEMEDIDIPELDAPSKGRKRKGFDDSDYELDDKRVAPIKIPKISLSLSPKKKNYEMQHSSSKVIQFPSPVKGRLEPNRPLFQDSAPDSSEASGSSSGSSESSSSSSTSSSSSDESDVEADAAPDLSDVESKPTIVESAQRYPIQQVQSRVDSYVDFHSDSFVDPNSDMAAYGSEGETSESALVIAEESNDQSMLGSKAKKVPEARKRPAKKPAAKQPLSQTSGKERAQKPKPGSRVAAKKKDKVHSRPMSAYMLWCAENRKRIVAQTPDIGFSAISKKLGEMWKSLPDKEKMAWRRKAKKNAMKSSGLISTGRPTEQNVKVADSSPTLSDDMTRGSVDSNRTVGTAPIDVAAYLKLLGESLSIIGQRLTEHEGQIAVSGSLSVLLDSTLCALAPLLCLTSEVPEINGCTQETLSQILDNIAYMMPGL